MKKISTALEELIQQSCFLEDGFENNYINLTAFATYIRPYIKKETHKDVSIHAIKMALSRMDFPKSLKRKSLRSKTTSLTTRTDLSIVSITKNEKNIALVSNLFSQKKDLKDAFILQLEGTLEIDIIYDNSIKNFLEKMIPKKHQLLSVSGLGIILLRLSDDEISAPGLFYRITKNLAFHNINIIQVISTYHELGIIVKDTDIKKTVNVLLD